MDIFVKTLCGVLIALVLYLVLAKQGKEISLMLTIAVCCMIAVAAVKYFKPVIDFIEKLQTLGQLDTEMVSIVLKSAGIGMLAEITSMICNDAGNAAMGKTLQILTAAVVLWMSVPLFTSLIELIEEILLSI